MTPKSFLTSLSPIEFRPDDPDGKIAAIRETLLVHEQENSPFSKCPMVHMARVQIIDQLTPPMGEVADTSLQTRYLLFIVDMDGSVDDFLDCLYRIAPTFVQAVWGKCVGYPAYDGAVFFRRYIHRCMFTKPLGYAGFGEDLDEILEALTRKQMLAEWVAAHQHLDAPELQDAWHKARGRFLSPETPKPGTF